ncbi:Coatomer subunit delta [Histomonas meleagridis]|uniref:Coatomer subunit delta n=1 Tax=Histomonas meleagridis TaxID=135588 RepID=UPI00355A5C13|nr:Coatomer subunit delta [Histomonas meleagridis]KAH0801802.1 Coatomer subunit delta [Histomonas meleagridis]
MILSISIITKKGRTLVARQFNHLTRSQVEGNLSAFPKLITNTSQSYIETESIRYVFQDIGDLYFILMTTKDSNILEDLDLLNLLIEVTREVLKDQNNQITEKSVVNSAIDLILAYDECIFDGYRQTVTLEDVKTFLLMESKDEDEAIRTRELQEQEAKRERDQRIKEIEKQKKLQAAMNKNLGSSSSASSSYAAPSYSPSSVTVVPDISEQPAKPRRPNVHGGGMVLGKKATARERAQQMIREEGLTPE